MEMVSKDLKSLDIEVDMFYDSDEWCKRLFHIINTEINQTKQQIPGNKLTCSIWSADAPALISQKHGQKRGEKSVGWNRSTCNWHVSQKGTNITA